MEVIQIAFLPLGVFWVTFKTMMDAAVLTNNIRETIVLGVHSGKTLSVTHRKAMFVDWCFSMTTVIFALRIVDRITCNSTDSDGSIKIRIILKNCTLINPRS